MTNEEAIKILKSKMDGSVDTSYEWAETVRMAIKALKQPEPQWIPVTERLPEDEQNVLVTYKTTDKIHPCQYHADGSKNPWYSYIDQCRAHMNVVLAWMPLPEPYKGET